MLKHIFALISAVTFALTAQAEVALTASLPQEDLSGNWLIDVAMDNTEETVVSLQFDLTVPAGITYESYTLSARSQDYNLVAIPRCSSAASTTIRVLLYNLSLTPIQGHDGSVATFAYSGPSTFLPQACNITNIVVATVDESGTVMMEPTYPQANISNENLTCYDAMDNDVVVIGELTDSQLEELNLCLSTNAHVTLIDLSRCTNTSLGILTLADGCNPRILLHHEGQIGNAIDNILINGTCGDNLTWTLEDGVLTISGTGAMKNYDVVLEPVPWNESRESITALVVEEGVTSIGNHAFNGLTSLQTAQLPSTLERIGQRAFNDNVSLESVTLPEALTRIEDWAFANCTSLSAFAIPANTTYVATTSIERCSSLQSISVAEENSQYISVDGVLYDRAMTMVHTYPAGKSGAYVIPDGVTSVARAAFNGCTQLSSIVIPEGVTSIGSWGFASCSSLTSVELPESLESMAYQVFTNCTSLVFIKSLSEMPATLGVNDWHENTFVGMPSRTILFVRSANIENYRNDEDWSQAFSSIIPIDATYDFANGQTYKMRLANNPDLYIAVDKVANLGTESGDSAVKFSSEEDASLLVFAQMGEAVTITDAATGRGICNSRAVHWRFSNTDTDAWWVDYNSSDKTLYLISRYGYWKTDNEEIGCSLYTNGDKNLKLELVPCSAQNLYDGAPYVQERDLLLKEVTYTRTFNNTEWQALYVPFQMSYEDWEDEFDVAQINNFHQYDTDNDDVFDTLEMEIIKVKNSTLKQNTPYLIRAKETGLHTITLPDATLYAAEENSCVCMSMSTIFTFTGTYTGVSGEEMYNRGYYSMGGGALIQAASTASGLKPYRWYLQMESRDGMVIPRPASVRVKVFGEDDLTTGVEYVDLGDSRGHGCFDLQGRVANSKSKGLYIINGKKVLR